MTSLDVAIDAFGDGIVLIDAETARIVNVNEVAANFIGSSRHALIGLTVGVDAPAALLRGDLAQAVAEQPRVLLEEFVVHHPGRPEVALERRRRALWLEERWMVLDSYRVITAQKRAQATEYRLAKALDLSVDGFFLVDYETHKFLEINEAGCRIMNITRDVAHQHGPLPQAIARFPEARARSPEVILEEQWLTDAQGVRRPYEIHRQAFQLDGRWVIAASWRDISDRKAAAELLDKRLEELARSNLELEQFAYVVSHDLSEPLRGMAAYGELLRRRYTGRLDQDGREFIGFIVDGAARMRQLIDDLLMYSRVARAPASLKPLALEDALDDALANLEVAIHEAAAVIHRDPLPVILGDRSGMMQLFQNLIGNAVKFHGEATPVVRITAMQDAQEWIFSVSDNGIGIAPAHFERIFLIFQRLHDRSQYEGTGIGLAMCKRIVERHGGRIWVESRPGEGASFRFTVPRGAAPD